MHRVGLLYVLTVILAATANAIYEGPASSQPASVQYSGVLTDGSTVTVSLMPPTGQIAFSNQWTITDVHADAQANGVTFAGEGMAGDHSLAVSGTVNGDAGTMEIKTGVGLGAKSSTVQLKKK